LVHAMSRNESPHEQEKAFAHGIKHKEAYV